MPEPLGINLIKDITYLRHTNSFALKPDPLSEGFWYTGEKLNFFSLNGVEASSVVQMIRYEFYSATDLAHQVLENTSTLVSYLLMGNIC